MTDVTSDILGNAGPIKQVDEVDYRLEGKSCWLEVGKTLLYIREQGGGLRLDVYRENAEGSVVISLTVDSKSAQASLNPEGV